MKPVFAALPLMLLLGCPPAEFRMPLAPTVPEQYGAGPRPPEARPEDPSEKVRTPVDVQEARAPAWALPAQPRIAVLPVGDRGGNPGSDLLEAALADLSKSGDGPQSLMAALLEAPAPKQAGPTTEEAWVERRLPFLLLTAGHAHFVGPEQLRAVSAQKEATRDGTVVWRASLADLVQVEPVAGADVLLGVQITNVERTRVEIEVGFVLDANAMSAYRTEYARYRPAVEGQREELAVALDAYRRSFEAAKDEYASNRGRYGGSEPTSGDLARAEERVVVQRLNDRLDALQFELDHLAEPDGIEAKVASSKSRLPADAVIVSARARVVDARTMRVLWLADLETRDHTFEAAMDRILREVVETLPAPATSGG